MRNKRLCQADDDKEQGSQSKLREHLDKSFNAQVSERLSLDTYAMLATYIAGELKGKKHFGKWKRQARFHFSMTYVIPLGDYL